MCTLWPWLLKVKASLEQAQQAAARQANSEWLDGAVTMQVHDGVACLACAAYVVCLFWSIVSACCVMFGLVPELLLLYYVNNRNNSRMAPQYSIHVAPYKKRCACVCRSVQCVECCVQHMLHHKLID